MTQATRLFLRAVRRREKAQVKLAAAEQVQLQYADNFLDEAAGFAVFENEVYWADFADGPEWVQFKGIHLIWTGQVVLKVRRLQRNGKPYKQLHEYPLESHASIFSTTHPLGEKPPKFPT